jgi:hypothetical protein
MTEPTDLELLELATPYGLNALSDSERADIDERVADAPAPVAAAFADEVRGVREAMALASAATAAEPPARLREAILASVAPAGSDDGPTANVRRFPWRTTLVASIAAAIVAAATVFGIHVFTGQAPTRSVAEQILSAPDVRTVSGPLGGGTATVMFSRDRNEGVLVMNNVPPPSPGTVYQMWLIGDNGPTSAGTMNTAAVWAAAPAPHLSRPHPCWPSCRSVSLRS